MNQIKHVTIKNTYPEKLAGQAVQGEAGGSLREHSLVQCYVALQHEGVGQLFLGSRYSKVKSSRRVSRAVKELCPGVAKVDFGWIDDRAAPFLRLVVNNGRTGSC